MRVSGTPWRPSALTAEGLGSIPGQGKKKKMRIPRASNLYKVTNQLVARVADMFQSKVHGHPSIHLFVFIEQIPDLGGGSGWRDGRGVRKHAKPTREVQNRTEYNGL